LFELKVNDGSAGSFAERELPEDSSRAGAAAVAGSSDVEDVSGDRQKVAKS